MLSLLGKKGKPDAADPVVQAPTATDNATADPDSLPTTPKSDKKGKRQRHAVKTIKRAFLICILYRIGKVAC